MTVTITEVTVYVFPSIHVLQTQYRGARKLAQLLQNNYVIKKKQVTFWGAATKHVILFS